MSARTRGPRSPRAAITLGGLTACSRSPRPFRTQARCACGGLAALPRRQSLTRRSKQWRRCAGKAATAAEAEELLPSRPARSLPRETVLGAPRRVSSRPAAQLRGATRPGRSALLSQRRAAASLLRQGRTAVVMRGRPAPPSLGMELLKPVQAARRPRGCPPLQMAAGRRPPLRRRRGRATGSEGAAPEVRSNRHDPRTDRERWLPPRRQFPRTGLALGAVLPLPGRASPSRARRSTRTTSTRRRATALTTSELLGRAPSTSRSLAPAV